MSSVRSVGLSARLGLVAILVGWFAGSVRGAEAVVIDEDFEGGAISGNLLNVAQIVDLGDGRSSILSLTQGVNDQSGFAWFSAPFNLRTNKVTIDLDFWIRSGTSADPADGMSVIFQFGSNTSATGAGGGGLGTGNFPTPYVSVAFDIWDNGAFDPETACDVGNRTCHVEVNQNINPGTQASRQTNIDFGVAAPNFTAVGDTLVPIHATIVFDSGSIEVQLQTDGDPAFLDPVTVLRTALQDFPTPANAIIGFAASTGGANAHHEIDNLVIVTSDPTPRDVVRERLGGGDRGAINCGSTTEVTGAVGGQTYTFVPDVAFGSFLRTRTDVVPNQDIFAAYGHTLGPNAAGPSATAIAEVGDSNLQNMYQTERWNNGPVAYAFEVNDGRFEVDLHFAETCPGCGINAAGQPTRIVSATIDGEEVLTHWSAAQAAGNDAGTGPVAFTAVVRTFEVDVTDGLLDIFVSDLGLNGTPAENAQLNGISYRRLGPVTGAAATGDIESFAPIDLPDVERIVIVDTGFDEDDLGVCPNANDWRCSSLAYNPQVVDSSVVHGVGIDPRLRLTDTTASVASAVFLGEQADLSRYGFEAEFTVFLTQNPAVMATVADGMTFFFLPYEGELPDPPPLGAVGGSLGINGMGPAIAFEIDTYQGTNDPNGIPQTGSGHFGIVFNGDVTQHLQTSASFTPYAQGAGWPLSLVTDPASPDLGQLVIGTGDLEALGTAGLRVKIDFNNGRLRAWVATVNEDPADGFVYPETKVIDTQLAWAVGSALGRGYFGFTGATGGAMTYHEVDEVKITLTLNKAVEVARRVGSALFTDSSTPVAVALDVAVMAGTGPHAVRIVEALPSGWTAQGISGGGTFSAGSVTWNLTGLSASTSLTYQAVPSDLTKEDVVLGGTFAVGTGPEIPIDPSTLRYAPPPFARGASDVLIADDFEGYADGECPDGWTCNGGNAELTFAPGVTLQAGFEGRLRLADQTPTGYIASTVIWNEPLDLTESSFVAEFDAYFSLPTGTPADGLTFMILDGAVSSPTSLGAVGGGLGYLGLSGIAVELDLYQGGTDPSGYNNTTGAGYAHMAVIRDGVVATHVQTHVQLDPARIPTTAGGTGWPEFVDRIGTGIPLTVEVDYNNGRIQVYLSAPATATGPAFSRVLVLDTAVTFPGSGGDEPVLQTAYLGFSAGTGGAWANHEVDDVSVRIFEKSGGGAPRFRRGDADASDGVVNITDAIFVLNYLFQGGAEPPCLDAADADDEFGINITDGIYILSYLFLGGPAPPDPGPDVCGPDPAQDPPSEPEPPLDCKSYPPGC